jgi:hypothetical protein
LSELSTALNHRNSTLDSASIIVLRELGRWCEAAIIAAMIIGEDLMIAVISQHLLASELHSLEEQVVLLRTPAEESEALLRLEIGNAQAKTMADCKHLEVTLQAARCEHTAADAALQRALERADELLREAAARLFVAQDELSRLDGGSAALESARSGQLPAASASAPPAGPLLSLPIGPPDAIAATPRTATRAPPTGTASLELPLLCGEPSPAPVASEGALEVAAAAIRAAARTIHRDEARDGGPPEEEADGGRSASAIAMAAASSGSEDDAMLALPALPANLSRTESRAFARALAAAIEATSSAEPSAMAALGATRPTDVQPNTLPYALPDGTGQPATRRPDLAEYVRNSLQLERRHGAAADPLAGPGGSSPSVLASHLASHPATRHASPAAYGASTGYSLAGGMPRGEGGGARAGLRRSNSFDSACSRSSKGFSRPPAAPATPRSPEYSAFGRTNPNVESRHPAGARPPRPRFVGLPAAPPPTAAPPRQAHAPSPLQPPPLPPPASQPSAAGYAAPGGYAFTAGYGNGYGGGYSAASNATYTRAPAVCGYASPGGYACGTPATASRMGGGGGYVAGPVPVATNGACNGHTHGNGCAVAEAGDLAAEQQVAVGPSPHLIFRPTLSGLRLVSNK